MNLEKEKTFRDTFIWQSKEKPCKRDTDMLLMLKTFRAFLCIGYLMFQMMQSCIVFGSCENVTWQIRRSKSWSPAVTKCSSPSLQRQEPLTGEQDAWLWQEQVDMQPGPYKPGGHSVVQSSPWGKTWAQSYETQTCWQRWVWNSDNRSRVGRVGKRFSSLCQMNYS